MAKLLKFPKGFYWGASTSSHQVEGGNKNDWSIWEKENAGRLANGARVYWQLWRRKSEFLPQAMDPANYISGKATDHYGRFREDFDIAKALGHNAHRLSIEWSRVEPSEGKFDDEEIEHYRTVISELKARGIEPFVTLFHFTLPIWVRSKGGWASRQTARDFAKYAERVVSELSPGVKYWITLNEPTLYSLVSNLGFGPWMEWPYVGGGYRGWFRMSSNLVAGHKGAHHAIKALNKSHQVGIAQSIVYFDAFGINPLSRLVVRSARRFYNHRFLKKIRKYQDFVGINYFTHNRIRVGLENPRRWFNHNENKEVSDLGWELYPEGIYKAVKEVSIYRKPIYITENGIADTRDLKRAKFIKDNLEWLHRAISDGADVRGYFHWSLLDNFEWGDGFWPKFGLVEIDYKNGLKRKVRQSAKEYAKIIKTNAVDAS